MTTTHLSTKGQVVIPKEIRERHAWEAGTKLEIEDHPDHVRLRPARRALETTVDDLLGCLPYAGTAKSLQEMEEAIRAGAVECR